jgi:hypothetical protein
MRRVPICRSIAPPTFPSGRLTECKIGPVLSQQRFELSAEIRIDACEQSGRLAGSHSRAA